jgi:topoisomerase-4 subunit A
MDPEQPSPAQQPAPQSVLVAKMYEDYFLDYASYVILERAVPSIYDGLKPVQRRILHSMKQMDDGRYHKVANVIGQTMQYHPHGDAAIGEALVNMGQKDLLIDCQGNWGDYRTGDGAAAPRYIEGRLTKFALEIAFNADTTHWQYSYDGRKKEPINLPVKFPLLLAQGVEGIAVGLSTKILPHNFIELCKASIDILRGRDFTIYPDFPTGGTVDVSDYREGMRGGRVRVRARIEQLDKKTLVIRDLPFGVTTGNLIESIVKASNKNKIKIKKVVDNTAKDVDVRVELQPGTSPDVTIDALYAVTDCEVSISPLACVIVDDRPQFMSVHDILRFNTAHTKSLLKWELENELHELTEKFFFSSLEKIFIENRIYRDIEECESWDEVLATIHRGLAPFTQDFVRAVTDEDVTRLTEIKIKRISKYNSFEAEELLRKLADQLAQVRHHLEHLVDYAVDYFKRLLEKYGKGRERKTQIQAFDRIEVQSVVANNTKLFVNRADGFIGFGLKKDEFVCDCSDIDDLIVFRGDGQYLVTRISEKAFVGKDILHIGVWKKGDDRTTYNAIYTDAKTGISYAKRFHVDAVTRDREYPMSGKEDNPGKIHYFSANPNGEAEIVEVQLSPGCTAKNKLFEFNFAELAIKGRASQGNQVSKFPVRKVKSKKIVGSTLSARKIWYDPTTGRLNTNSYGNLLGEFATGDQLLALYKDGTYELTDFELTNRYELDKILSVTKLTPETVVSALYWNGIKEAAFVKRFRIETSSRNERFSFLSDNEHKDTSLVYASIAEHPRIEYKMKMNGKPMTGILELAEFTDVKGWKALGSKFSTSKVAFSKELAEEPKIEIIIARTPEPPAPEPPAPKPPVEEEPPAPNQQFFKPGDSLELF